MPVAASSCGLSRRFPFAGGGSIRDDDGIEHGASRVAADAALIASAKEQPALAHFKEGRGDDGADFGVAPVERLPELLTDKARMRPVRSNARAFEQLEEFGVSEAITSISVAEPQLVRGAEAAVDAAILEHSLRQRIEPTEIARGVRIAHDLSKIGAFAHAFDESPRRALASAHAQRDGRLGGGPLVGEKVEEARVIRWIGRIADRNGGCSTKIGRFVASDEVEERLVERGLSLLPEGLDVIALRGAGNLASRKLLEDLAHLVGAGELADGFGGEGAKLVIVLTVFDDAHQQRDRVGATGDAEGANRAATLPDDLIVRGPALVEVRGAELQISRASCDLTEAAIARIVSDIREGHRGDFAIVAIELRHQCTRSSGITRRAERSHRIGAATGAILEELEK